MIDALRRMLFVVELFNLHPDRLCHLADLCRADAHAIAVYAELILLDVFGCCLLLNHVCVPSKRRPDAQGQGVSLRDALLELHLILLNLFDQEVLSLFEFLATPLDLQKPTTFMKLLLLIFVEVLESRDRPMPESPPQA